MEAANQAAASPKTEQTAGKEQSVDVEQSGASAVFRSLSLGGGSGGNKPKPTVTPGNILQLQRMVGNQSVQRLIQRQMAQKNTLKTPVPARPQPAIVARDYGTENAVANNPDTEEDNDTLVLPPEEEETQIVQVTDLDVLDNVNDEDPLPDTANELENQPSANDAPPDTSNNNGTPNTRVTLGSHRTANPTPAQQQQPQQQQPAAPPPNAFQPASKPTGPQDNQSRTLIGARDPKTYDQAANLQAIDVGEEKGQGHGNTKRTSGLVNTPGVGLRTRYLSRIERRAYRVTIQGGVFKDAKGANLDSSGAQGFTAGNLGGFIFVMSRRGKFYAADMVAEYDAGGLDKATKKPKPGVRQVVGFHHSSFKSGKAVAGAGELVVKNGVLEIVTDGSGHYQPDNAKSLQVLLEFQKNGVNLSTVRFMKTLRMGNNPRGVNAADFVAANGDFEAAVTAEQNRLNPPQQQQPQGQAQQQPQQNGNGGVPFYQF